MAEELTTTIETLYRTESGRVLATLVRLLGDLDLAEESMQEAFAAALESWTRTGIPDNPRPWLISTARFNGAQRDLVAHIDSRVNGAPSGNQEIEEEEIEDDRLRLIFTCCHPALPPEGQVALTLREICRLLDGILVFNTEMSELTKKRFQVSARLSDPCQLSSAFEPQQQALWRAR